MAAPASSVSALRAVCSSDSSGSIEKKKHDDIRRREKKKYPHLTPRKLSKIRRRKGREKELTAILSSSVSHGDWWYVVEMMMMGGDQSIQDEMKRTVIAVFLQAGGVGGRKEREGVREREREKKEKKREKNRNETAFSIPIPIPEEMENRSGRRKEDSCFCFCFLGVAAAVLHCTSGYIFLSLGKQPQARKLPRRDIPKLQLKEGDGAAGSKKEGCPPCRAKAKRAIYLHLMLYNILHAPLRPWSATRLPACLPA